MPENEKSAQHTAPRSDNARTAELSGPSRSDKARLLLLFTPIIIILCVVFIYPILSILHRSIYNGEYTLYFYQKIFDTPIYVIVLLRSLETAAIVTGICLLFGYILAFVISIAPRRLAVFLLVVTTVPFFTSVIVRTYAWMILLGDAGLVNQWLVGLGLIKRPAHFMYNRVGVIIGMTYILLPFMIYTLYGVMKNFEWQYVRAAYSMGARPFYTFRKIFFPLTIPGVVAGCLLTFILALGLFITPSLMGGPRNVLLAMLIQNQIEFSLDWSFAAALSALLLVVTLVCFYFYGRLSGIEKLFGGR